MLDSFFFDTAAREPDRPALWVDERLFSYAELAARAQRVAAGVTAALAAMPRDLQPGMQLDMPLSAQPDVPADTPQAARCLLFAHRSVAAYAGLLGILEAGCAYVPLNPTVPAVRIAAVIEQSGADLLLVDRRCAPLLDEVVPLLDACPRIFMLDDADADAAIFERLPLTSDPAPHVTRAPGDLAYILFTSGSTGAPKGVPISHANAEAYVDAQLRHFERLPDARYIQFCELTFDPSVHDMFVCWANGACLYVPKTVEPIYNAAFIKQHGITHWNSVPSVAAFMQQFRKLPADGFPTLRMTVFGGEPLSRFVVQAWLRAAPHTRIMNLYGPTETTVGCAQFEVTQAFADDPAHAVMPLGHALPGMELLIVDADLEPVAPGESGELLIGGPQVAPGYLSPNEAGNRRFVSRTYAGCWSQRWYRSADAAREVEGQGIVFQGRLDSQVKIRGNRIELEEVEHVVQDCSRAALCAVIAWPVDDAGRAGGLIAFVTSPQGDHVQILQACRQRLPVYAVPQRIVSLDALPLNVNGKIDRKALALQCVSGDTVA
ncbi:D-alanine--poly(phosphoribitol) ligase subunit 1 [Paraburkholderia sp. GAS199]|uniref:amino acid adenylation domain-containing protein n=1 Tax=Paraburkholderia sp. GAS199 TaxID=3035126 RepID=UPI003D19AC6A